MVHMHLETREEGGKRRQYLAASYRKGGAVRKVRVFLGTNLLPKEVEIRRDRARAQLSARLLELQHLPDPYLAELPAEELERLKSLTRLDEMLKVHHLSEDDWERFTKAFTYDTNAIEGSTLESREVANILGKDKWPDKPKEEISETYGVARAVRLIRETDDALSLPLLLELHRLTFENSKHFAGQFRKPGVEVAILGPRGEIVHRGAPSREVPHLLEQLADWYRKYRQRYPPLLLAAVVHNQFENIHPFEDGNGRVGRLLLNNILLKHGLPPVNIELRNRKAYYASLQAYEQEHDLRPTLRLLRREYRALAHLLKKR